MPPPDNVLEGGASGEEFGRNDKDLKKIRTKFHALSADIKVANNNIFTLMRTERAIANWTFSALTKEQDEDLFKELAQVNEYLGTAHTMLDSYIILTNSTPKFQNFFNIIYDLMKLIENHRKSIFFQVHVRQDGKYLYPKATIEDTLWQLTMLFGRLCGTLQGGGEFISDISILESAGQQRGGDNSGYNNGYDRRYRSSSAPAYPENEPREERDLGM